MCVGGGGGGGGGDYSKWTHRQIKYCLVSLIFRTLTSCTWISLYNLNAVTSAFIVDLKAGQVTNVVVCTNLEWANKVIT